MSDPAPGHPAGTPFEEILDHLMRDVRRTRRAVRDLLDGGGAHSTVQMAGAREEAKAALESFVAALHERSLPVPRLIHDELQLTRGLCAQPWASTDKRQR